MQMGLSRLGEGEVKKLSTQIQQLEFDTDDVNDVNDRQIEPDC